MSEKDQPKDEFLEAEVERALQPYRGLLPAAELAALEATVRDTLENDPVAVALLNAARPRPGAAKTTNRAAPGASPRPAKKPSDKGER